ncbi:valyl-tRNA synthetase [Porphyromonas sp. COT-108 OH2963]|uniref:valine--tRNA ligase n=1 Tax=Porphyromonas sp. COT-108 OH2963 TaxID=1515614 RepID=UPI00052B91C7|nr:valine--tRNA ligase [Porphyromonas sp. COT-108 OH2963]KGN96752.1 valyl-tRNA synthetase [Porphyromonas sp. COT-108 OH2963]
MNKDIASKYDPSLVEDKWYKYWMENKIFSSKPDAREPYTIVMPPPNVTGVLHMGHMLNNSIQDILIRRARMMGKNALWVPGTDHASIATEAKVVNKLAEEGIKKSELTREQFLDHAWEWTDKHGGIIMEQLKKLGASCDWDRTAFTMDENRSQSVIDVFVDLYNKGYIYRGVRMVNWDPKALTALSDEEVIYKEEQSKLYYLKYEVVEEPGKYIIVATTRPETILGDTAVCVHPEDERYSYLKDKHVRIPLVNREIPIIMDEYVEREFGTGCLKVTPAHDVNDYMLGEKYALPSIDIFNDNGTLNEYGLQYKGMDRFDVRKQIAKDLTAAGLMEKEEAYVNKVGCSERTQVPIEPKLSMQWFLDMKRLAQPAIEAVKQDDVLLVPSKFKNTYFHWMENIKDWCISRQLWWGHRIPAYFLPQGGFIVASSKEEALVLAREKSQDNTLTLEDLRQEEDCLDTWFSSWLWPISVFGSVINPTEEERKELEYYYPTSDLVTGPDILFFWVARMIMAGYEYTGKRPFGHVYLTGIVRDAQGRKMSKSLGNSPDPLDLIAKYGADGVRMGLMTAASAGNDILFDESLCEQGRNFNNKIWNAFRLVCGWDVAAVQKPTDASVAAVSWFRNRLSEVSVELADHFDKYRLSDAMLLLYKLFWDDFSACYLELVKPAYGSPIDAETKQATLDFFSILMQLLHPFMPFITEELWQLVEERKEGDSIMKHPLKIDSTFDATFLKEVEMARELISQIRNLRVKNNISPKEALSLYATQAVLSTEAVSIVCRLANIEKYEVGDREANPNDASIMIGTATFAIPMEGFIDTEEELKKLHEEVAYYEKFLLSVNKKLENEKFVANAPEQVVALERKKQSDANEKLETLRERIAMLGK